MTRRRSRFDHLYNVLWLEERRRNVSLWPEGEVSGARCNVRFGPRSGLVMLTVSSSPFDPKATFVQTHKGTNSLELSITRPSAASALGSFNQIFVHGLKSH